MNIPQGPLLFDDDFFSYDNISGTLKVDGTTNPVNISVTGITSSKIYKPTIYSTSIATVSPYDIINGIIDVENSNPSNSTYLTMPTASSFVSALHNIGFTPSISPSTEKPFGFLRGNLYDSFNFTISNGTINAYDNLYIYAPDSSVYIQPILSDASMNGCQFIVVLDSITPGSEHYSMYCTYYYVG